MPVDPASLSGAVLKLIAAVFFNMGPISALVMTEGFDWTNWVGICFFHAGNMVSVFAMRNMRDRKGLC